MYGARMHASLKLSWTRDEVEENYLSSIEKCVCAAYDPHNCFHTMEVERLRFLLLTKLSDNKLRKPPPTREAAKSFIAIFCSAYIAGQLRCVTLQPSDQIPSPVDWKWKYSKDNRFVVDCCRAYGVNLNAYLFTCNCKGLCSRCKCVKKELSYLSFCSCVYIATRENVVGQFIYNMQRCILNPSLYDGAFFARIVNS